MVSHDELASIRVERMLFTTHWTDDEARMAVETLYRSTRDLETTFVDRKLADAHDQMLELAELLTDTLIKHVPGISEKHAEDVSIYMAKNRSVFAAAFKNNASALSELSEATGAEN